MLRLSNLPVVVFWTRVTCTRVASKLTAVMLSGSPSGSVSLLNTGTDTIVWIWPDEASALATGALLGMGVTVNVSVPVVVPPLPSLMV